MTDIVMSRLFEDSRMTLLASMRVPTIKVLELILVSASAINFLKLSSFKVLQLVFNKASRKFVAPQVLWYSRL